MKLHHPPHLYLDNVYYFLTARTYEGKNVFNTDGKKTLLLDSLKAGVRKSGYILNAWVILDNHYHILFRTLKGGDLSKMIHSIHGGFSYQLNRMENLRGRKIFQNYWDRCIRDERDFWTHVNYIHHNPVKHSYTPNMADYDFSSYRFYLKKKGSEWLNNCFRLHPVKGFRW